MDVDEGGASGPSPADKPISPSPHKPVPWRSHWDDAFAEARAARKPVLVYADGEG